MNDPTPRERATNAYAFDPTDSALDAEVVALCALLNSLPGITTVESCSGHGEDRMRIRFKSPRDLRGLFILARCIDKRYWTEGGFDREGWMLSVDMSDMDYDGDLPLRFVLSSGTVGDDAYTQAESLCANIRHHLSHSGFMDEYALRAIADEPESAPCEHQERGKKTYRYLHNAMDSVKPMTLHDRGVDLTRAVMDAAKMLEPSVLSPECTSARESAAEDTLRALAERIEYGDAHATCHVAEKVFGEMKAILTAYRSNEQEGVTSVVGPESGDYAIAGAPPPAPAEPDCTCGHTFADHGDTPSDGPGTGCLVGAVDDPDSACRCTEYTPTSRPTGDLLRRDDVLKAVQEWWDAAGAINHRSGAERLLGTLKGMQGE